MASGVGPLILVGDWPRAAGRLACWPLHAATPVVGTDKNIQCFPQAAHRWKTINSPLFIRNGPRRVGPGVGRCWLGQGVNSEGQPPSQGQARSPEVWLSGAQPPPGGPWNWRSKGRSRRLKPSPRGAYKQSVGLDSGPGCMEEGTGPMSVRFGFGPWLQDPPHVLE